MTNTNTFFFLLFHNFFLLHIKINTATAVYIIALVAEIEKYQEMVSGTFQHIPFYFILLG